MLEKIQKFCSLLLKGIINVSDVVKQKNENIYLSHRQNLDNVKPLQDRELLPETQASIFILSAVLSDIDHEYDKGDTTGHKEHQNIITVEDKGKVNFFDFGSEMARFWLQYQTEEIIPAQQLKILISSEFTRYCNDKSYDTHEFLNRLNIKIEKLLIIFDDKNFSIFQSMLHASDIAISIEKQRVLFNNLQNRVNVIHNIITNNI